MLSKSLFPAPSSVTKKLFKNKNKKLLRADIVELLSKKENKISKNDLIHLFQILKTI
jgi:hypothetical protein